MAQGYVFDKAGKDRIIRAVKAVEGGSRGGGVSPIINNSNQCITATLTSRDEATGAYAWNQQRRTTSGWEAVTDGLSGTASVNPAWPLSHDTGPIDPEAEDGPVDLTGSYVVLVRMPIRQTDSTIAMGWVISGGAGGGGGGAIDLQNEGANAVSGASFVNLPATRGTSDIFSFTPNGAGGDLVLTSVASGGAYKGIYFNGTSWVVDWLRAK